MDKELLIKLLDRTNRLLEDFVVLKKDEKGFYIEYAFKPGAPHDNRCLSWYDSYQENAYKRNGWFDYKSEERVKAFKEKLLKDRLAKVGKIFKLSSFTCGWEEKTTLERSHENEQNDDFVCKVGKPSNHCIKSGIAADWSYKEPVKCACWHLSEEINPEEIKFSLTVNDIKELLK